MKNCWSRNQQFLYSFISPDLLVQQFRETFNYFRMNHKTAQLLHAGQDCRNMMGNIFRFGKSNPLTINTKYQNRNYCNNFSMILFWYHFIKLSLQHQNCTNFISILNKSYIRLAHNNKHFFFSFPSNNHEQYIHFF